MFLYIHTYNSSRLPYVIFKNQFQIKFEFDVDFWEKLRKDCKVQIIA